MTSIKHSCNLLSYGVSLHILLLWCSLIAVLIHLYWVLQIINSTQCNTGEKSHCPSQKQESFHIIILRISELMYLFQNMLNAAWHWWRETSRLPKQQKQLLLREYFPLIAFSLSPTEKLGVKIAEAADCRNFAQRKKEEEALEAAQKRQRQIAWGYDILSLSLVLSIKSVQHSV